MKKYKVEIDATVKGQKDVEKLNTTLGETADEQENVSEGFSEIGGAADGALGGAVSKFAGLKTAITSSVRSLGVLKVAVAATGLGLLLLVIASIKAAFTSSEAGQNKYAKLMNALGVITGNIIDLFAELGNIIISAFENPKQAVSDLWDIIKTNFVNRVEAIPEYFKGIFKTIANTFSFLGGKIKQIIADIPIIGKGIDTEKADKQVADSLNGMKEGAIDTGKALVKMATGIEADDIIKFGKDAVNAVKDIIEETEKEIDISNKLSDAQADLDKKIRAQLIKRAKLEGEIANARLSALDTEKYSLQERIDLLEEAGRKTDEIFKDEVEIAKERLRQVQERNKLSGSKTEDLLEEAQLEADLIRLEKQRSDGQRKVFTEAKSLRNQAAAEKKATADAEIDLEDAKNKKIAADKKALDEKTEKERLETLKLKLEAEAQLWANLFASMDSAGQQWLSTLTQGIKGAMDEIKATGKLSTEAVMAVAGAALSAGAQLVNKIANEIDTSTREGFEKQKKLRVAGAIMDSFSAAIAGMLAGLSTGTPFGIILGALTAASSLAFGFKQVSNIKKQQFGGGGGAGGGGSVPRLAASTASPSFSSIAPASTGSQNITDALSPTETAPIKAYVVSENVQSGTALDRNIKANATI